MCPEQSHQENVISEIHHKAVSDALIGDARAHESIMSCLGRAAFRARGSKSSTSAQTKQNLNTLRNRKSTLPFNDNGNLQRNVTANTSAIPEEETEAGDRAIEDFSRALLQAIPNIVDVIFSALGAIVSSNQKIYS